jgi:amicyanin
MMSIVKTKFQIGLLGTALSLGSLYAASAPGDSPTAEPTTQPAATVTIDNFEFSPQEITIAAGQTVTWVNHDDVPHTVVSQPPVRLLRSHPLDTDETYSYTFSQAGTYDYYCTIHTHMTGRVIVKPVEGTN